MQTGGRTGRNSRKVRRQRSKVLQQQLITRERKAKIEQARKALDAFLASFEDGALSDFHARVLSRPGPQQQSLDVCLRSLVLLKERILGQNAALQPIPSPLCDASDIWDEFFQIVPVNPIYGGVADCPKRSLVFTTKRALFFESGPSTKRGEGLVQLDYLYFLRDLIQCFTGSHPGAITPSLQEADRPTFLLDTLPSNPVGCDIHSPDRMKSYLYELIDQLYKTPKLDTFRGMWVTGHPGIGAVFSFFRSVC